MDLSKTLSLFLLLLVLVASATPINSEFPRALVRDVETRNPELATRRVCADFCREGHCSVIDSPRARRSWQIDFPGVKVTISTEVRGKVVVIAYQLDPSYDLWVISLNDQSLGFVEALGEKGEAGMTYTFPSRRLPASLTVTMYPTEC